MFPPRRQEAVSRSTDLRLLLKSYDDANLRFRSDNFLVTRIDSTKVTFAAGEEFPKLAMHKLAKQLHAMGYRVDSVLPEALLQRNENQDSSEPEFVVPFATETLE